MNEKMIESDFGEAKGLFKGGELVNFQGGYTYYVNLQIKCQMGGAFLYINTTHVQGATFLTQESFGSIHM